MRIPSTLRVTFPAYYGEALSKVDVIKSIRTLTGMGLKESKDLSEKPGTHTIKLIPIQPITDAYGVPYTAAERYDTAVGNMRANGVLVEPVVTDGLQANLQEAARQAISEGRYDLATDLLAILIRYT